MPAKWERWGSHFDAGVDRTPTALPVRWVPYSDGFRLSHEFGQEIDGRGIKLSSCRHPENSKRNAISKGAIVHCGDLNGFECIGDCEYSCS